MNDQPMNQPEPAPTVQPPVIPVQPTTPQAPLPRAPKKNLLWLWLTLGVVGLLVVVGAILFFVTVYPAIQARTVADAYMVAVKTGDNDLMMKLSGTGSNSLTQRATEGLKGATYKYHDMHYKENKGYVVNYDVQNSAVLRNTTVIVLHNKVTTFNTNAYGSVATQSPDTSSANGPSACLTLADLQKSNITYIDQSAIDAAQKGPMHGIWFGSAFFNADSTTSSSDRAQNELVGQAATLYKNNPDKKFGFSIAGATHESAQSSQGVQLANDRANTVKDAMVAAGIPASKITIDAPTYDTNPYDATGEADRSITIQIELDPSCSTAATCSGL